MGKRLQIPRIQSPSLNFCAHVDFYRMHTNFRMDVIFTNDQNPGFFTALFLRIIYQPLCSIYICIVIALKFSRIKLIFLDDKLPTKNSKNYIPQKNCTYPVFIMVNQQTTNFSAHMPGGYYLQNL